MQKNWSLNRAEDTRIAGNESRQQTLPHGMAAGSMLVPAVVLEIGSPGYIVSTIDEAGNLAATYEGVAAFPAADYDVDDEVVLVTHPSGTAWILNTGGGGCAHGLTWFGSLMD